MSPSWILPLARFDDWITLVIFVILFLGPAIVKMLKRGQTENQESEAPPSRPQRPVAPPQPQPRQWSADSDEVRKFLEALGKPKSAPPPPPVLRPVPQEQPAPPRPPRRRPVVRPPPVPVSTEGPSEEEMRAFGFPAERVEPEAKPMERIDLGREFAQAEAEFTRMAHAAVVAPVEVSAGRAREFKRLLADRSNVRRAFVLAEILTSPVSTRERSQVLSGFSEPR